MSSHLPTVHLRPTTSEIASEPCPKLGNNTHSYSTSTKLSMKVRNITIQLTFCLPSVLPVGDLGKSEVWISFQIYIISQTILNLTLKGQKRKTAKKDDQEPARTCSLTSPQEKVSRPLVIVIVIVK